MGKGYLGLFRPIKKGFYNGPGIIILGPGTA